MKTNVLALVISLWATFSLQAQTNERYIEVTGTSEIEIVPDKIHYLIEIREYFEEEFDGKSKPEEYRTKVPLSEIEQGLRDALTQAGISPNAVRTQEIGDYWRQQGQDFLVSKSFDITLTDFNQINEIVRRIDTKGIHTMRIGELENKDMPAYHQKGKIEALKAAQQKAAYLVEALGKKLGNVIRIVEESSNTAFPFAHGKTYQFFLPIENKKLTKIVSLTGNDLETSELLYSAMFCINQKNAFFICKSSVFLFHCQSYSSEK